MPKSPLATDAYHFLRTATWTQIMLLFAALNKDVPLLEACVMIVAGVYMLANLAAELMFGILNPRIRYA